jgi:hypothetical protein
LIFNRKRMKNPVKKNIKKHPPKLADVYYKQKVNANLYLKLIEH